MFGNPIPKSYEAAQTKLSNSGLFRLGDEIEAEQRQY